jgi:hypothetical protein
MQNSRTRSSMFLLPLWAILAIPVFLICLPFVFGMVFLNAVTSIHSLYSFLSLHAVDLLFVSISLISLSHSFRSFHACFQPHIYKQFHKFHCQSIFASLIKKPRQKSPFKCYFSGFVIVFVASLPVRLQPLKNCRTNPSQAKSVSRKFFFFIIGSFTSFSLHFTHSATLHDRSITFGLVHFTNNHFTLLLCRILPLRPSMFARNFFPSFADPPTLKQKQMPKHLRTASGLQPHNLF